MISVMRVVSDQKYHDWLQSQRANKFKPLTFEGVEDPQAATFAELGIDGTKLYATYCAACHGATGDGSGLPGVARDFRTADDWKRGTKVTDIFRTLTLGIDGTQMRPYPNLSPWERVALAHHVRAFLSGDVPADSQADYDQLVVGVWAWTKSRPRPRRSRSRRRCRSSKMKPIQPNDEKLLQAMRRRGGATIKDLMDATRSDPDRPAAAAEPPDARRARRAPGGPPAAGPADLRLPRRAAGGALLRLQLLRPGRFALAGAQLGRGRQDP